MADPSEDPTPLDAYLAELLAEARLTQRELASAVGYLESEVSRWRHGHRAPSVVAVWAIAEVVGKRVNRTPTGIAGELARRVVETYGDRSAKDRPPD